MTRVVVVSAGPDWASIMTAIGTVAVAAVAVGVALFAEWRADKRVAGERRHSAAQLQEERKHSAAQLAEERRIAQEREQLTEAYAVQVLMGERDTGEVADRTTGQPVPLRRVAAIIINHGRYTITHVEAQLRLSSGGSPSLVPFDMSERVPQTEDLDDRLRAGMSGLLEAMMHGDRLTPWDLGIRFESDPMSSAQFPGAFPVVRWRDRWGTCWEHRRGEVRQIRDGEEWQP